MLTRGFFGRGRPQPSRPLPPGQYLEQGFPVLSAGPTPRTPLDQWTFRLEGDGNQIASWTWDEFGKLPHQEITVDIHCVTKWSKLDTTWRGVTIDALLKAAEIEPVDDHVMAFCDGGYTANLPLEDLVDGKAIVAVEYEHEPLPAEHGGPARLLVPHLYFWKSAKWLRGLRLMTGDAPGFWEVYGYHMYGDPWREQRYSGD